MSETIIEADIVHEMRDSYMEYAMSVIVGRAIPDVRDGLKPVHRRVLFSMSEQGNDFNKPYRKSARVVGDVIGKYHPHGDTAVYDTIVRLTQNFSMRYQLIDGQGNFGFIDVLFAHFLACRSVFSVSGIKPLVRESTSMTW